MPGVKGSRGAPGIPGRGLAGAKGEPGETGPPGQVLRLDGQLVVPGQKGQQVAKTLTLKFSLFIFSWICLLV